MLGGRRPLPPIDKKTKQNTAKFAKGTIKAARVVAKPAVKFGKFLIKNNKAVNDAFKYGARP